MLKKGFAKFISWIDRLQVGFDSWIAAFTGIVFVRFFLEGLSYSSPSGMIAADAPTLIHYWLSFLAVLMGIAWVLTRAVGRGRQVIKMVLFGLPVIWLGPLFDQVFSLGNESRLSYFFHGPLVTLIDFFVFLTPFSNAPPGMKMELGVILACTGFYVWMWRRKWGAVLVALAGVYAILFMLFALPSLIYVLAHLFSTPFDVPSSRVAHFLIKSIAASALAANGMHPTFLLNSPFRAFEIGFDFFMAQVYFIVIGVLAFWWFWSTFPDIFKAILRNGRPERLGFYLTLLGWGVLCAYRRGLVTSFSWIDAFGAAVLLAAWAASWMYAVHVNDAADQSIDALVNPERPLVRGVVSAEVMRQAGLLWLLVSLLGTYIVGNYLFFMNLVFTACYYIYSAEPLRLKRVPLLSSFLIALAALSTVLAGFFFLSADKHWNAFPFSYAIGIVAVFTLGVNMRDIKDVEGDRALGIQTLPVLFGRYGVRITGGLFAASFLLVPPLFHLPMLWVAAVPAALAAYFIAVRKPYEEKWTFLLYFCFLACALICL